MNILKNIWLYTAKKKIIEKYGQLECDRTMYLFMREYRICEHDMFNIHVTFVQILKDIDKDIARIDLYEQSFQKLISFLEEVKRRFEILFKQYHHSVRMYLWMYIHGHHKKYAQVFNDGQTFKSCYENKIEKYEMEFKPFDITLKWKKYKITKRKKELENDFD